MRIETYHVENSFSIYPNILGVNYLWVLDYELKAKVSYYVHTNDTHLCSITHDMSQLRITA